MTYSGNTADGANIGFQWYAGSRAGTLPVVMTNNTVTNASTGVLIRDDGAAATMSGNSFANSGAMNGVGTAISVAAGASLTLDGSVHANTISGFATGVLDSGSATITGNDIYDNATGILFTAGGSGSVSGNDFDPATLSNGTDLLIDSTADAAAIAIGDGNTFAGSTYYIQNLSGQAFDLSGYTSTTFGGFNAATSAVTTGNLPSFYAVEDEIVDYLDSSTSGYVRIKSGYGFVAHSSEAAAAGAIQRGINAANTDEAAIPTAGDIVEVQAGLYVGQVVVDKNLTISGQGNSTVIQRRQHWRRSLPPASQTSRSSISPRSPAATSTTSRSMASGLAMPIMASRASPTITPAER